MPWRLGTIRPRHLSLLAAGQFTAWRFGVNRDLVDSSSGLPEQTLLARIYREAEGFSPCRSSNGRPDRREGFVIFTKRVSSVRNRRAIGGPIMQLDPNAVVSRPGIVGLGKKPPDNEIILWYIPD